MASNWGKAGTAGPSTSREAPHQTSKPTAAAGTSEPAKGRGAYTGIHTPGVGKNAGNPIK